jgi:hypothetical protein
MKYEAYFSQAKPYLTGVPKSLAMAGRLCENNALLKVTKFLNFRHFKL